ncbi:peptidoglycan DD-metalloendopeptidase family protein [Gayadomonas joobiniege]|uniref:peptidoglycan DD-metalloendopeptidase family protein n=1 Tax=Gayadomonas joobiniege TaxID=1234606 RepID=UPI0003828415|nr:peptidoglycan DD-metalloendopeptidase family protein [Gayadomonas joobiniege]
MRFFTGVCFLVISLGLIGCAQRGTPAPVKNVYQGPTIHDFKANSLKANRYQVEKGDTLYSIAYRAGTSVSELAKLNRLTPPYEIYPGQVLSLKHKIDRNQKKSKIAKKKVAEDKSEAYVIKGKQNVKPSQSGFNPTGWQWPSRGEIITRFSHTESGIKAVEIAGKRGSPVVAANSGKVVYAGRALRGYGNLIIIKHSDDFLSAYAHNDVIRVKEKDWVTKGQQIAEMGDTDADRVKLRFEIRYQGSTVNPEKYLPKR